MAPLERAWIKRHLLGPAFEITRGITSKPPERRFLKLIPRYKEKILSMIQTAQRGHTRQFSGKPRTPFGTLPAVMHAPLHHETDWVLALKIVLTLLGITLAAAGFVFVFMLAMAA